jgi:hypothetical protein
MRSEFDKEIDSLLREGARRGRSATVRRGAAASEREEDGGLLRPTPSGAHLDADEQNAYAENSLPPSARTYYAAHLADCDDCRRSVTQLALAAGTPAQLEQQATAAATGREVVSNVTWRERIGALFAPRAWRYAVPALALLLVGAAALLVLMRERPQGVSVAEQRNTTAQSTAPVQSKPALPETHHAPQNSNAPAVVSGPGDATSASNSNAQLKREEVAGLLEGQGQTKTGAILSDAAPPPPAPLGASAGTTSAHPAAVEVPVPMATPMPVPEEMIITQDAEKKTKAGERTDEFAKDTQKAGNYENIPPRERISGPRRNNEQSRNMQRGVNTDTRDSADKNDRASVTESAPASPAATRSAAKQREADGDRRGRTSDDSARSEGTPAPKPAAETRTVAGRKFRRTGDAWIDTAYQSGQAVTIIRRNSEQYRALVADEPQLRRISDALGGDITVVWKGRAYRIR